MENETNLNIKLNEKEKQFLIQYAELFEKERKLDITPNPIVLVETRKERICKEGYGGEEKFFIFSNDEYLDTVEVENAYEELKDYIFEDIDKEYYSDEEIIEFDNELESFLEDDYETSLEILGYRVERVEIEYFYEPKAFFLTRKEAEEYCEYQKHNLCHPRVYTYTTGYSNEGDLHYLIKLLYKMGLVLKEGEKNETI